MQYQKIANPIKSPLRYPGGKSKAINKIIPMIPKFKEYREPFVGGGSIFISLKQRVSPKMIFKINDLNKDLYCFWKELQNHPEEMISQIRFYRETYTKSYQFHEAMSNWKCKSNLERAVRFFIINRCTFSGLCDCGGYSQESCDKRFTLSSIERLCMMIPIMQNVHIFNDDYSKLLSEDGNDVFIYLDPPYMNNIKKKLYGKEGDLHLNFDHHRFVENMKKCKHKWLITYDDSPEIRKLFEFANIYPWELQYGMNNSGRTYAEKGKELFIFNYDLDYSDDSLIPF